MDLSLRSLKCQAYAVQLTCTAVPPGASSAYNTAEYMQAVLYIQSSDVYSTQILDTQKRIGLQCVQKK